MKFLSKKRFSITDIVILSATMTQISLGNYFQAAFTILTGVFLNAIEKELKKMNIPPDETRVLSAEIIFGVYSYTLKSVQTVRVGPGWEYWIDQAVRNIYNDIPGTGMAKITMTNETGETFVYKDQFFAAEEWLKPVIISARLFEK